MTTIDFPDHTAYRLTFEDEQRITTRIGEVTTSRRLTSPTSSFKMGPAETETLRRCACGSIGCCVYDLRDSEIEWIDARIAEVAP